MKNNKEEGIYLGQLSFESFSIVLLNSWWIGIGASIMSQICSSDS